MAHYKITNQSNPDRNATRSDEQLSADGETLEQFISRKFNLLGDNPIVTDITDEVATHDAQAQAEIDAKARADVLTSEAFFNDIKASIDAANPGRGAALEAAFTARKNELS